MAKILVVDDKEMMRDSVATILGRKGHSVIGAHDGETALAKLAEKKQLAKAKLAAKEEELEVLEKKNRELSVKASALEDIVTVLKSKVVSLLSNESGGTKRNHEADQIVRKKFKMLYVPFS